jgi:UDP-3-O-[3-hydroxymyristoyl] glucosamine N-acyltransferase
VGTDAGPVGKPCIRVERVKLAFIRALELFAPGEGPAPGVHPTAVIGEGVSLGEGVRVGAFAVIGDGARLGERTIIDAHAVLGEQVETGPDCRVRPHAVLYPRTVLGARVTVHSGAVIGADGYGYEWDGRRHRKVPQIGRVRLCDDVEVGANSTIDRATTGETVIGPGTKIDNLVQIGHNVRTGAHCLIISQTGIAGSAKLGNGVVLAGQVGVKDHIEIGDGVQAAGKSGVWGSQPPGVVISGHPARPHREQVRIEAALGKLPELMRRVRELERRLAAREGE